MHLCFLNQPNKNNKMKVLLKTLIILLIINQIAVAQETKRPAPQLPPDTHENFKLGIAGYTFVKFDINKTLETMKRADVHYLCIKNFHLPLTSTNEEIKAFHAKLDSFEVKGYAVGPLYMKTKDEVDKVFEYAKRVGVKTIVGVPSYELLPYVSEKVAEYNMKFAIHLHGPDIDKFPDAEDVWENVKDLDPRMGICLDIGHDRRNGKDPVKDLKKYHSRVFDVHLKDVTAASKQGYSVEVGRGILDIPGFVKMLRKVKYTGVVSLEHERNKKDPFMGIAESIGYFRGVLAATIGVSTTAQNKEDFTAESKEEFNKRMQWFTDAKYGMFIHFGLYSQLGGVWKGKTIDKYAEWIQAHADITPQEYAMLVTSYTLKILMLILLPKQRKMQA